MNIMQLNLYVLGILYSSILIKIIENDNYMLSL